MGHAEDVKKWSAKQIAAGKCRRCVNQAEPNRRQCARHMAEDRERLKKYYVATAADRAGRAKTRVELEPGFAMCRPHLDIQIRLREASEAKHGRKRNGKRVFYQPESTEPVCPECGANPPMRDQALCWCCIEAARRAA